jgi:hypothetical protein
MSLLEKIDVLYTVIDIPGIIVSYSFLHALYSQKKSLTTLMARPGLTYAIAYSSFPRRPIALPNAFIILSYIISLLGNASIDVLDPITPESAAPSSTSPSTP